MSRYTEFFLNSRSIVVNLETIEISHPNFSEVYRIVRNATEGITVKIETGEEHYFKYYPLKIENAGIREDLDQSIKITVGDLGQRLPNEIDAIAKNDGFSIKPKLIYRSYRSDDLSSPLVGAIMFEVTNFTFTEEGASFEAKAPSLNVNKTGEGYKFDRFPMLRGFL